MTTSAPTPQQLRDWDNEHVWHPFTPMQAFRQEQAPIIARGEGFDLIDVEGNRYLDGVSSLWCNVHGHCVPEIDAAIRQQLDCIAHTTMLGLSSPPAIELAKRLVDVTPAGLTKVFYSDSGSTSVEAALKIAYQYHQQKPSPEPQRKTFATLSGAYHGDTIGSVSVGSIDLFHRLYGDLLFPTATIPSPVGLWHPAEHSRESYLEECYAKLEQLFVEQGDRLAAFVIEPLVQGAAGILVHPEGYLRRVRELTKQYGVLLIADEVAVGFGRTGTLFACEQENVQPDLMCVAKGISGGYLPLAATLATDEIFNAFLGAPSECRTFFHGHTYTGNPLACAAALASLDLFQKNNVLANVHSNAKAIAEELSRLTSHPHVAEVRQRGMMVGIELVQSRDPLTPFPSELRLGHQVIIEARKRGVIIRPLGDVIVLMPAPAMPEEQVRRLCRETIAAIETVCRNVDVVSQPH
ncbi:MAG: adenosylmethionine--8-amino-7-oxononanoate transaminase [Planctomycetaceae bacterium]|nr:adenosylmethionine--8-amino-7-oxononanoate transaminase [Planctomycetaceae bacterium]MCB9949445.1 adenosylmethionine--8-amino-7-oxononanoate transaminase [Planctomycetaceae bacterium]